MIEELGSKCHFQRKLLLNSIAAIILITLTVQPSSAASVDFQINGAKLIYMNIGDEYQLDYITGGTPHEFISSSNLIVTVNQNGLLNSLRSGSTIVLLRSLKDSNVADIVNITISPSQGQNKYAVSYTP
jgi:hypothetical protein